MTLARAEVATQWPFGSAKPSWTSAGVASGRVSSRSALARPQHAGVLGEEEVGLGALALLEELRGELARPGVANLDVDSRLVLELVEQRADEVLVAPE